MSKRKYITKEEVRIAGRVLKRLNEETRTNLVTLIDLSARSEDITKAELCKSRYGGAIDALKAAGAITPREWNILGRYFHFKEIEIIMNS